ncbi:hypothetical protein OSK18_27070, partial [Escherichia coli]|nr:hypothetical protein [Escherichia coli]
SVKTFSFSKSLNLAFLSASLKSTTFFPTTISLPYVAGISPNMIEYIYQINIKGTNPLLVLKNPRSPSKLEGFLYV